jgi:hypothetical protein
MLTTKSLIAEKKEPVHSPASPPDPGMGVMY